MKTSEKNIEIDFLLSILKNHIYKNISFSKNEEYEDFFISEIERLNNIKFSEENKRNFISDFVNKPNYSSFKFAEFIWGIDVKPINIDKNRYENFRPKLIDWENIEKNNIVVCQQPVMYEDGRKYIPDILILLNGMPFIVIELKNENVKIERALDDLFDYREKVFSKGLFRFIQILAASNNKEVKIMANNRRQKTTFAFKWENDNGYSDLKTFSTEFLSKKNLINFLKTSFVLKKNKDEKRSEIIILRPYQNVAVKRVLEFVNKKILENKLDANLNKNNAYVWHATGTGKTITSFKVAKNLSENKNIDKVIFLLDRRDLSFQTISEFSTMSNSIDIEGSEAKNTKHLSNLFKKEKFIITTIQKMYRFLTQENQKILERYKNQKIVFIIDECHRSQMGLMNDSIKRKLKNSILIGFTGTPIFKPSAKENLVTESIFGNRLHTYSILNAIKDKNILKFSIKDYYSTGKDKNINYRNSILKIKEIISKKHFNFTHKGSFNSIFAFDSKEQLIEFYKKLIDIDNIFITAIFTDLSNEENEHSHFNKIEKIVEAQKLILENYNKNMGTSFTIDKWEDYVKDVQYKFKNIEFKIDILLVVDMLLTGYDSKFVNTLYINKEIKDHSIIQAFSRTNRIFNEDKRFGNIINFALEREVIDEAFSIYADKDIEQIKEIIFGKKYQDILEVVNILWKKLENSKIIYTNDEKKLTDFFNKNSKNIENFISNVKNLKKNINDLKTFEDFKEEDIMNFKNEKLVEYINNVKKFKKIWKDKKIEFKLFLPNLTISDFDVEDYDEINIDYDYILKLLNINSIQSNLVDKKWEIHELLNKLEELHQISLKNLEEVRKIRVMEIEEYENQKDLINSWYLEFINQIKNKDNKNIYSKNDFKNLKDIVLWNLLDRISKHEIKKIKNKYPEINEDLVYKDFDNRKKTKIFNLKGSNQPNFIEDYFSKKFDDNKVKKLQEDYKNLLNYYDNLEKIINDLIG